MQHDTDRSAQPTLWDDAPATAPHHATPDSFASEP